MGMSYREIQDDIIEKYRVKINTNSNCWSRMHAHVKSRTVCKWKPKSSAQATFDLMHEVGHIETTKAGMRRVEQELYATLWAFDRCREYGMKIPKSIWTEYKEYIEDELDRGIRRGGSGYPEIDLPTDIISDSKPRIVKCKMQMV